MAHRRDMLLLLSTVIVVAAAQNDSFSGAQGIIYSPGYPNNYSNLLNELYTISVEPGYYVSITLYDFATEACCDILYIWDGDDTSMSTIANVSGNAIGQTLAASGPLVTLLFHTDLTRQDRGFAIYYEMIPINEDYVESHDCQSGFFSDGFGFVTSPDWPSPYPNDITCYYLMTAPEGSKVMVMFVAFSTEACCDKVEIYDGPDATYPKLATLSGTDLMNTTYYSSQQSLFMTFYSDLTENNKGFSAFYKEIA